MTINHVNLQVTDIDLAIDFYVNKLGFQLLVDSPYQMDGEEYRWVEIGPGLPNAAMFALQKVSSVPERPRMIATLSVPDVRAIYDELCSRGVPFDGEPVTEFWGTGVTLVDPFNNMFYLGDEKTNAPE